MNCKTSPALHDPFPSSSSFPLLIHITCPPLTSRWWNRNMTRAFKLLCNILFIIESTQLQQCVLNLLPREWIRKSYPLGVCFLIHSHEIWLSAVKTSSNWFNTTASAGKLNIAQMICWAQGEDEEGINTELSPLTTSLRPLVDWSPGTQQTGWQTSSVQCTPTAW